MIRCGGIRAPVRTGVLVALMLASAGIARAVGEGEKQPTVKALPDQMHQIELVKVAPFAFRPLKQAIGQIAFNEDASTVVLTPFSGRVKRLFGKVGDQIRQGDPLFEIDSPEVVQAQTDLIASVQGVEKARSQLALARRVLDRQSDLLAGRATSQREVDQARNDHAAAESDLKSAEGVRMAARNKIRVLLERSDADIERVERERKIDPLITIRSPIGGTIVSRKVGPGQYVRADSGEQLLSISDLSTMWLKALVPETEISLVRVGQEIEIRVTAIPDRVFNARITAIGASSDAQTHRVTVRSEIANPDRLLRPEMFASFTIAVGDAANSPSAPVVAILRDGAGPYVWVQKDGLTFERRRVRTGIEMNGRVQILEGLSAGETIVGRGAIFVDNEVK